MIISHLYLCRFLIRYKSVSMELCNEFKDGGALRKLRQDLNDSPEEVPEEMYKAAELAMDQLRRAMRVQSGWGPIHQLCRTLVSEPSMPRHCMILIPFQGINDANLQTPLPKSVKQPLKVKELEGALARFMTMLFDHALH